MDGISVGAESVDLKIYLQPIVEVATGTAASAEALARFSAPWAGSTESAFADAFARGRGVELEAKCLRAALDARDQLPVGMSLAVNVSPEALVHPLIRRIWSTDLGNVIVEVTEQHPGRADGLSEQVARLRRRGAAISIDDVSTGYSGLLRVASLRPDYVKIDRQIITGVEHSIPQATVLEALVAFSHRLDAAVIAEGIEHLDELAALAKLDVDLAQGYAIARPAGQLAPIPSEVINLCREGRRHVLDQLASVGSAAAAMFGRHSVTAALAQTVGFPDLAATIARAADQLRVDVIGVWMLRDEDYLEEVAVTGEALAPARFAWRQYRSARTTISTQTPVEVHRNDPGEDHTERQVLGRLGHANALLVPFCNAAHPMGMLELAHRTSRRWTSHDIAYARILADQLGVLLPKLDGTLPAASRAAASDVP
ncbi:MAG: EAL domain-containing protein [Nakamurella sp.]